MADTKISDLAAVTDVIATDEYVLARAGATKKIDASDLLAAVSTTTAALQYDVTQTGHGLAVADVVRLSGTSYTKAKADTEANAEVVGIVSAVAGANNFTLHMFGRVTGLSGLTAGAVYYISAATSGLLTSTEPTTTGTISKPVLVADTTTSGIFVNYRGIINP